MMRRIFVTFALLVLCGRTEALRRIFPGGSQAPRPVFSGLRPAQPSIIAGPRPEQLFIIPGQRPAQLFIKAAPLCAALSGCNLNCPNGLVKDANGCEMCQCRICDLNPCAKIFGPSLVVGCTHLRDKDGCELCECQTDPCLSAGCKPWQVCEAKDNVGYCFNTITGTEPPCPVVDCNKQCLYGLIYEKNNARLCPTCECYDPCEGKDCGSDSKCVVEDCAITGNCRDFDSYCAYICPVVECNKQCPYGLGYGDHFCRICECYDPCKYKVCELNEKCVVNCVKPNNCWDSGTCVAKESIIQPGQSLQIIPRATQAPIGANNLRATMNQCCSKVGLSGSCLATCVTDSESFFLNYPSCLPGKKVSEYLRCISADDFRGSRLGINQPSLWRLNKRSKTSKLKGEKAD